MIGVLHVHLYPRGVDIQIHRALSGSPVCTRFVSHLDSLDEWQRVQPKVGLDPEFHKMLAEMAPLVDGGKTNDQLRQSRADGGADVLYLKRN